MSGGFNLHQHDWETIGISYSIRESEVHGNFPHSCFMLLKRLLSSPPFSITLTCTAVHHEFRFLFMFNPKSVSVCAHRFNTEFMNKLHFCTVSESTPQSSEHVNLHSIASCLYFSTTKHPQKAKYI